MEPPRSVIFNKIDLKNLKWPERTGIAKKNWKKTTGRNAKTIPTFCGIVVTSQSSIKKLIEQNIDTSNTLTAINITHLTEKKYQQK
jgi:hypothetical protein